MPVLNNEEKIKSITLQIHTLLQELKDKIYADTCEADWIAKHCTYKDLQSNNIALRTRTALASYLTRIGDIREIVNGMYYELKNNQNDIESKMWSTITKWEAEHQ